MIRIALCDDNKEDMLQLHQKIIEWYRENSKNQSVSITEYSDSVYLSSVIDAGDSHDVFFLDVEMPKVDGFQLADKIRNKLPAAIIVFLTSHSELAPDGYKFRALRYVSKLVLSQKLPEALEAVQKEFSALGSGYLVVPHYTDALRIPYNEILYVQHILRSSQIYTLRQGVIKDNRGLKTIYSVIGDKRFIYIDRSTFVNIDFIRELKGNEIILRTGESLAISRPMLANVKETIVRMWR
ncbi:LytR/AlgR family response regulator transcription factor [Hominenteromicrobium sp.]|uniref:LytR/AlgR family response regulator transcription factor n=1 Tax=Hominenteromicrobium sp. TaxID=3073581 RepID=UPI003994D94C